MDYVELSPAERLSMASKRLKALEEQHFARSLASDVLAGPGVEPGSPAAGPTNGLPELETAINELRTLVTNLEAEVEADRDGS